MFTWICPQCGREVPPAYNDCPDCAEKETAAAQPQAPPPQPPQAPPPALRAAAYRRSRSCLRRRRSTRRRLLRSYAPQPPPPAAAVRTPPYTSIRRHRSGMNLPVWLMTILFALAIGGVVLGLYTVLRTNSRFGRQRTRAHRPAWKVRPPSPVLRPIRCRSTSKSPACASCRTRRRRATLAKFVIVNHSEADISGLAGNVTIWGRTQKSEEDAQGTFSFTTNLGPFETKELTVPMKTKLKIYELPDWQNVTTDVQITAPAA